VPVLVNGLFNVRRVVVTNELTHENMGDLVTSLAHNGQFATLLNHSYAEGNDTITNYTFVFDDSAANDLAGSQRSDGPGSLRNFTGERAAQLWYLTVVDDAPGETGRVEFLKLRIDPSIETNEVVEATIEPFSGCWAPPRCRWNCSCARGISRMRSCMTRH
jgi:subtilisin-like proprotein convertase family protein